MPTYNPNDFYPSSDAKVNLDGNVSYLENTSGTLLTSQARTANPSSTPQTNYNARGVLITLNVTASSGTGGLTLRIQAQDPASGTFFNYNASPTAVTATGMYSYLLYPGISGGFTTQLTPIVLPKTWQIVVSHGDGTSYTYSVGYSYIL